MAPPDAQVDLLCRVFDQDPHFNWLIRQDAHRAKALHDLFQWILGTQAIQGVIEERADGRALAVWYPPGQGHLDWGQQMGFLAGYAAIAGWRRLLSRGWGLNLTEWQRPRETHAYLQVLAVDPSCQGQGLGSALMTTFVEKCDTQAVGAYLETGQAANLAFYARFGFHTWRQYALPGGLTLWALWRGPQ